MNTASLTHRRITWRHAFFLGALLALIALAPAIVPYGGRFVTRGDYIEQQLPFILETRRILRGGLDSYSFSTFLGAPAWVVYACLKCDQILKCFVALVKINKYNWMKNLTRDNTETEAAEPVEAAEA